MTRLTIRVDFDSGGSLGPGKIRLLEAIVESGSIRKAASSCRMSFRQAWLLLRAVENTFGEPLTQTIRGGTKGGGTRLTSLGSTVVKTYRELEKSAEGAAKASIDLLAARIRAHPLRSGQPSSRQRLQRKTLKKS